MKKQKSINYIIGTIFIFTSIIFCVSEFGLLSGGKKEYAISALQRYNMYLPGVFFMLSALGILQNKTKIIGVGFAMCAAVATNGALQSLFTKFDVQMLCVNTLPTIGLYCACIAALSDSHKMLYCISGITLFLKFFTYGYWEIFVESVSKMFSSFFYFSNSLNRIAMLFAGFGFILLYITSKSIEIQNPASQITPNTQGNDALERLTMLKSLMDQGIISKDDFEKKKTEIIENYTT